MDNITFCIGDYCGKRIDLGKDVYGKDFYIIIDLVNVAELDMQSRQDVLDGGHVQFYCKNCGTVHMAEAAANGFEIVSKREGKYL